ncbi:MAG: hypothetical protein JWN57_2052 [Frankiales bacterium]|nr:hypothetical protein [Frankiales bacterium]
MRKHLATLAIAGMVGLTGSALIAPGLASAATGGTSSTVADRVSGLKDALKGLVSDGTIDQAQADKVAATLAEKLPAYGPDGGFGKHGGPGGRVGPAETAAVLGITVEELRTAQQAGKTLAQIAQAEGMAKPALIDKLVAAAEKELAEAVTAGRLTQAQADTVKTGLRARVTDKVDQVRTGRGDRGHRHHDDAPETASTPSTTSTPSPTA